MKNIKTTLLALLLIALLSFSHAQQQFLQNKHRSMDQDGESYSSPTEPSPDHDGESESEPSESEGNGLFDWVTGAKDQADDVFSSLNPFDGEIQILDLLEQHYDHYDQYDQYDSEPETYGAEYNTVPEYDQYDYIENYDAEPHYDHYDGEFSETSGSTYNEYTEITEIVELVQVKQDGEATSENSNNNSEQEQSHSEPSEEEEENSEGGFFEWVFSLFTGDDDGEGGLFPDLPIDGEFITDAVGGATDTVTDATGTVTDTVSDATGTVTDTVSDAADTVTENVPNPLADGEQQVAMFIDIRNNPEMKNKQVKQEKVASKCKDPVQAKFGDNVWEENWQGVWEFNQAGDQYGVSFQGEFLPLVQFNEQGEGSLLFEDNCGLTLDDFFDRVEVDYFSTKSNKKTNLVKRRQQQDDYDYDFYDGEYNSEYYDYSEFEGFDGELGFDLFDNIIDGVFDFVPDVDLSKLNPLDGESYFQVINPLNYDLLDGEFYDDLNPLDNEYVDEVNPLKKSSEHAYDSYSEEGSDYGDYLDYSEYEA